MRLVAKVFGLTGFKYVGHLFEENLNSETFENTH